MTPSPNKQPIPNPFGYQPAQGNEQYGPFTNALAPDQPQRQNVQPSGYGGAKEALAMFASKFLEGAQAGRRQKFEESERTKMEHAKNFDSVYEHIANNPAYTKEAKDAAFQAWSQQRFGDIQKQMSEGEKGSKGKGKSGGNAKPENPLMHIARSVVGHVLGPGENKEHKDFGPESVHDLLRIANDPKSQLDIPAMVDKAAPQLETAFKQAERYVKDNNLASVDEGVFMSMPSASAAVRDFEREGIDYMKIPRLAAIIRRVQPAMTETEKQELATKKSQADLYGAEAERYKADAAKLKADAAKQNALNQAGTTFTYTDAQGKKQQMAIRFPENEGAPTDLRGAPIPEDHPVWKTGHPSTALDAAEFRSANTNKTIIGSDGTVFFVNAAGAATTITDPKTGKPIKGNSPFGNLIANHQFTTEREAQGFVRRLQAQLVPIDQREQSELNTASKILDDDVRKQREAEIRKTAQADRERIAKMISEALPEPEHAATEPPATPAPPGVAAPKSTPKPKAAAPKETPKAPAAAGATTVSPEEIHRRALGLSPSTPAPPQ